MGYLFIILALMCGITKGFCGKKTSGLISSFPSAMLFNAVRMLICIPIGLLFVFVYTGTLSSLAIDGTTLLISLVTGISTSIFVVTWLIAVRTGAYMMVDVFPTLGVIIPVIACRLFFAEPVKWNHLVGILMLVAAAYIMCTYNSTIGKAKLTPASLLLLSLCGFSNGLTSFAQKWFQYTSTSDAAVYNFYTYIFSAVTLLLCWTVVQFRQKDKVPAFSAGVVRKLGVYVVIMSMCLFMHSFFSTMAAGYLSSSQLYPLMQGGALVLSMLMCAIFFGEKITLRCLLGIGVTFAALLCINVL
jgi:drug/metabolite transporter (DMT)-like permease